LGLYVRMLFYLLLIALNELSAPTGAGDELYLPAWAGSKSALVR